MSYSDGISYLKSKTNVIELYNQFGGRVAVCPDWNGRVMTSSCNGAEGSSFGLIDVKAIESGISDWAYSFYGGEDQLMFSPEGGPFSIYHTEEVQNIEGHLQVPVGFREGSFQTDLFPMNTEVRMRRSVQMTNLAGVMFDLDIIRTVKLLDLDTIRSAFGDAVAVSLEQTDISYAGFSTVNTMLNRGTAFSRTSGLISMRFQSMFNANPATVAVIPLRAEANNESEHPVQTEFFGSAPHGRVRSLSSAVLLRCDGKHRCQVSVSPKRAVPYLGSIDFRDGSLTLLAFDIPPAASQEHYLYNDYYDTVNHTVPEFTDARKHFVSDSVKTPIVPAVSADATGDCLQHSEEVLRAYNHGPSYPGDVDFSPFYKFDVFSSTKELTKGDSLTHHQHTLHINADNKTLGFLIQKIFGVDYDEIYEKMIR